MSRDIYAAHVDLSPDQSRRSGPYVVLLPRSDASGDIDERALKELRPVSRLSHSMLPFQLPEFVGAYPKSGRLVLVRRFVPGIELDLRAGRQPGIRPWDVLGEIMAAVHGLDRAPFEGLLPGSPTRREHALGSV